MVELAAKCCMIGHFSEIRMRRKCITDSPVKEDKIKIISACGCGGAGGNNAASPYKQ